ncbi:MAG TPA: hypothetical protein DEP48_06915 [Persephonella sp.]|uniref:Lipoprotein n=1 Tax=Persephonella marina (strain DSM 14350 / EX-H1) TaxID=123214 RepID=C0QUE0_PERMH|nr:MULTISPECIES: hypothetical protein [Persephonella]ACO03771.1 hypothetical protein PERMA_0516 [Persephonella marina EX-H1]HCB70076.1 hypothetical protein [Persephonella sp.]
MNIKSKKAIIGSLLIFSVAFSFPFQHQKEDITVPLNVEGSGSSDVVVEGCIGDCAACHSITPYEAKSILDVKFDVKKILNIDIKRGYFEIIYENSEGKKEKINLFFGKDKACREVILLDE